MRWKLAAKYEETSSSESIDNHPCKVVLSGVSAFLRAMTRTFFPGAQSTVGERHHYFMGGNPRLVNYESKWHSSWSSSAYPELPCSGESAVNLIWSRSFN